MDRQNAIYCGLGHIWQPLLPDKEVSQLNPQKRLKQIPSDYEISNYLSTWIWFIFYFCCACQKLTKTKALSSVPIKVSHTRPWIFQKVLFNQPGWRRNQKRTLHLKFTVQGDIYVKEPALNERVIWLHTGTHSFNSLSLPPHVNAGYEWNEVHPYMPVPLCCFNCKCFGHGKDACWSKSMCLRCGCFSHWESQCENSPKYTNFMGDHPASSREYPWWQKEK